MVYPGLMTTTHDPAKTAALQARIAAYRLQQNISRNEALAALRDNFLNRAVEQKSPSLQKFLISLGERTELVMSGGGDSGDLYVIQSRLDDFLPNSGVRLY